MPRLRSVNMHRRRKQLWAYWRPRYDAGDFNAMLMSLEWRSKSSRYFRTPKAAPAQPPGAEP